MLLYLKGKPKLVAKYLNVIFSKKFLCIQDPSKKMLLSWKFHRKRSSNVSFYSRLNVLVKRCFYMKTRLGMVIRKLTKVLVNTILAIKTFLEQLRAWNFKCAPLQMWKLQKSTQNCINFNLKFSYCAIRFGKGLHVYFFISNPVFSPLGKLLKFCQKYHRKVA